MVLLLRLVIEILRRREGYCTCHNRARHARSRALLILSESEGHPIHEHQVAALPRPPRHRFPSCCASPAREAAPFPPLSLYLMLRWLSLPRRSVVTSFPDTFQRASLISLAPSVSTPRPAPSRRLHGKILKEARMWYTWPRIYFSDYPRNQTVYIGKHSLNAVQKIKGLIFNLMCTENSSQSDVYVICHLLPSFPLF